MFILPGNEYIRKNIHLLHKRFQTGVPIKDTSGLSSEECTFMSNKNKHACSTYVKSMKLTGKIYLAEIS